MVIIAALSTDIGSSSRTTDPVIRVVHRLLFPTRRLTPAEFALLSVVLRKSAHVFEYAALALLLCRWLRFTFAPSKLVLHSAAVAIAGCWASLDELHQLFVPSRTGASRDVLIDVIGAVVGTAIFVCYRRAEGERRPRQSLAGSGS
jgi:VanZ family protein